MRGSFQLAVILLVGIAVLIGAGIWIASLWSDEVASRVATLNASASKIKALQFDALTNEGCLKAISAIDVGTEIKVLAREDSEMDLYLAKPIDAVSETGFKVVQGYLKMRSSRQKGVNDKTIGFFRFETDDDGGLVGCRGLVVEEKGQSCGARNDIGQVLPVEHGRHILGDGPPLFDFNGAVDWHSSLEKPCGLIHSCIDGAWSTTAVKECL